MAAPNANEQDKYSELTSSIVSRMLMSDPKLAVEPEKVFEQARKVSDVLGPQGFTGVDRITNLPGGVTVYQQGDRTSQLTFDDAKKIVETSVQQSNPASLQPANVLNSVQPVVPTNSSEGVLAPAPSTVTSVTINNGLNANVTTQTNNGEGTLTGNLNVMPGATTTATASVNYVSHDSRPGSEDGKTPAVASSTQIGTTVTSTAEGIGVNASAVLPINGREGTLTGNLKITPGTAADTASINYVSNDSRPASADGKTEPLPSSTQIGVVATNSAEGFGINANAVLPINGREGTLTSNVNITPGINAADTASVTYAQTTDKYNNWRVGADYTTGTPGVNGTDGSPGGLNVSGAYNAGNQSLNYGVNATVGRDNIVGGFVNAQTATLQASAQAQYNLNTNEGQVAGRVAYNPSSDVSVYGGVSAKTNGETVATVGVNIGNPNQAAPQFNAAQQRQQLDSNVVDYRIAQLGGNDRKLYDQALVGVNKLNEGGANLPTRETALSLAALADSQKPPLNQIGDVRLGPAGADGSQKLYVGNGLLDNPGTRSASVERNEAANTPPEQNLAKLSENNLIQSLQSRGNQQQSTEIVEQNQPSRAIAGR